MTNGSPSPQHSAWLRLATSLQVAVSPSCLALAAGGFVLMHVGQWLLDLAWGVDAKPAVAHLAQFGPVASALRDLGVDATALPADPVVSVPLQLLGPAAELLSGYAGADTVFAIFSLAWRIAVWSVFGLAIARLAVVECGPKQKMSVLEAIRFGMRKSTSAAGAPLAVMAAILLIALPIYAVSWCIRFDVGVLLAGLIWCVVLFFSGLMAILVAGLVAGWPLMWGAIATEDSDLFDAISRSYAYVFQRPANYLVYLLMAMVLGTFGWAVACVLAETVVQIAYWIVHVGGGVERTEFLRQVVQDPGAHEEISRLVSAGAWLIRGANRIPALLANAFSFAFFWSSAGVIYLLLRRDTDQTTLDDVIGI